VDQEYYPGNFPEDAKALVKELKALMRHPEQWIDIEDILAELEADFEPPENTSGRGGNHDS
jgi:hypothetical protein